MSGPAHDIQMEASRLVIARRAGEDWSGEEEAALERWLDESTAHKIAYWRADQAWSRTFRVAALKGAPQAAASRGFASVLRFMAPRIAASLIVIAGLGAAGAYLMRGPEYATYRTPLGGRETLRLSDGSMIELNTNTVLRFSRRAGQREVILDKGEAYFQVRHDPAHPFIVLAGGRRITDIGTKFAVRGEPNRLEVSLLEGRVLLSAPRGIDAPSADLTAGNVAIATASDTSITKRPLAALRDQLSWRDGVLIFHHTTLQAACAEFNRYNSRKLIVAGAQAGALTIDGKFRANDIEAFTETAEDVLHLDIERKDSETILSR